MCKSTKHEISYDPPVVEHLLKLGSCLLPLTEFQMRQSPHINRVETAERCAHAQLVRSCNLQDLNRPACVVLRQIDCRLDGGKRIVLHHRVQREFVVQFGRELPCLGSFSGTSKG